MVTINELNAQKISLAAIANDQSGIYTASQKRNAQIKINDLNRQIEQLARQNLKDSNS